MGKQQLYQVYYAITKDGIKGYTAYPVGEAPGLATLGPGIYWRVEKPVRASSARAAVRKVNTRTKASDHPMPFVNPSRV